MTLDNNRTLFWARLIISLAVLLAMLFYINFNLDLRPNSIIVEAELPEDYQEPEIYLNTGQGYEDEPITSVEVKAGITDNLKSLRIDINRESLLTEAAFILEEYHKTDNEVTTSWIAYLPSFNYDPEYTQAYIFENHEPGSQYQFYVGGINWPIATEGDQLKAIRPPMASTDCKAVTLIKSTADIRQNVDIRELEPGISSIFAQENEQKQVIVDSITVLRNIVRLSLDIPIKSWSAEEIIEEFNFHGNTGNHHLVDDKVYLEAESNKLQFENAGLSYALEREVSSIVNVYILLFNLIAILAVLSFFLLFGFALKNSTASNWFLNLINKLSNAIYYIKTNKNIPGVTLKKTTTSTFFFFLFVVIICSISVEGPPSTLLFVFPIIFGSLAFYYNKDKLHENKETVLLPSTNYYTNTEKISDLSSNKSPYYKVLKGYLNKYYNKNYIILLIIAIGGFLRFWNLGKLSLWGDEGTVFIASKNILTTGLPYLETGLLYLRDLPHLYITAASLAIWGENEFALRFPSAVAGTLLIIVVYFLAKKIVAKDYALLAIAIVSFHPWVIEYSRVARSYILMVLLFTLSIYFYLAYIKKPNIRYGILFALSSLLALYTHQIGQVLLLLAIPLILFYLNLYKFIISKEYLCRLFKQTIPFIIILANIFLYKYISRLGYLFQADERSQDMSQTGIIEKIISMAPFGTPNVENLLFIANPIPIIAAISIIFAIVLLFNIKSLEFNRKILAICTVTFMLAIVFSEKAVTINRALLFIFPLLTVITALSYSKINKVLKYDKYRNLVFITVIFILLGSSFSIPFARYGDPINPYHSVFEGFIYRQDHKTTYRYINSYYKKDDMVLLYGTPQYSMLYSEFDIDYRIWSGRTLTIDGVNIYSGVTEISSEQELEEIIAVSNRVWIITTYSIFSGTEKAPRIHHISEALLQTLEKYDDYVIYQSEDPAARVYFIEKCSGI